MYNEPGRKLFLLERVPLTHLLRDEVDRNVWVVEAIEVGGGAALLHDVRPGTWGVAGCVVDNERLRLGGTHGFYVRSCEKKIVWWSGVGLMSRRLCLSVSGDVCR